MSDGGWNCEQENGSTRGSFHTTIDVLEGLLEYERAVGSVPEVTAARLRGQEYLIERRMLRRLSTGEVIDQDRKTDRPTAWTQFSYPTYWHYDVLRGLDYLRAAGAIPDERIADRPGRVQARCGRPLVPRESPSRPAALRDGRGRGETEPVEHPPGHAGAQLVPPGSGIDGLVQISVGQARKP
jgi:hypothetical protein